MVENPVFPPVDDLIPPGGGRRIRGRSLSWMFQIALPWKARADTRDRPGTDARGAPYWHQKGRTKYRALSLISEYLVWNANKIYV